MMSMTDCIKELSGHDLKKLLAQASILTDETTTQLFQKLAKGAVWANDATTPDCKNDKALFKLYKFEEWGLVSSKIMHKGGLRYERRFYLTDLGRKLLNH